MAIIEETIHIKLANNTYNIFEQIGYMIPRYRDNRGRVRVPIGTSILVKVVDLPKESHVLVTKQCDYCGKIIDKPQQYRDIMKQRESGDGKDWCKECSQIKKAHSKMTNVPFEKSIAAIAPHLVGEWHVSLNQKEASQVFANSRKIYWWKGVECNHIWDMSPTNRVNQGQNCPYCSNQRVCLENCLATVMPDISAQWHPTKNSTTPYEYTSGSENIVWWLGVCGHEWDAPIVSRTCKQQQGCPYCSSNRVCIDNCLQTLYPEISKEWHPERNGSLTPAKVTGKSSRKVWWSCSQTSCKHEWFTVISHRTILKSGCPRCNESKSEKIIFQYLDSKKINFQIQYSFDRLTGINGGLLRFDFAIFDKNDKLLCLLEYDGEFHFKKIYDNDSYEIMQIHDKLKNQFCKKNNITLIRISYKNKDILQEILDNQLFAFIST